MNTEIEAKFLNINHDDMREKLKKLGATLDVPMRLMRRVVVHSEGMTKKDAFLRVRDEGYRTTVTYKQFDSDSIDGAKEYEVEVSNFDEMVNILSASGLSHDTYQESKRENWSLDGVEIMLDEWPWLNPYVEIEGASAEAVQELADKLGLDWSDAVFGGVASAYKLQYPHIGDEGVEIINHEWPKIKFNASPPELLQLKSANV